LGGRTADEDAAVARCAPHPAPLRRRSRGRGSRAGAGRELGAPLGPPREDGPLEPPEFDDALDDDEPDSSDAVESGRALESSQGEDEETAGESAVVTEEPDAEAADALFLVAVPDR